MPSLLPKGTDSTTSIVYIAQLKILLKTSRTLNHNKPNSSPTSTYSFTRVLWIIPSNTTASADGISARAIGMHDFT